MASQIEQYASNIYEVIKDYRNDDGISITRDSILEWAAQFGEDAEFVLYELNHLLPKVYFSKEEVKSFLSIVIELFAQNLCGGNLESFLNQTVFLDMQQDGKSQKVMLALLDSIVFDKTSKHLSDYELHPDKKNFIYLDDVLASGGTIGNHLIDWLSSTPELQNIIEGKKTVYVCLICCHRWGWEFLKYRLANTVPGFTKNHMRWCWAYEIQNHLKFNDQSLNIAIPVKDQPQNVFTYLSSLQADKYKDYAFREDGSPINESFFTSAEDRIKYENILLQKGLYIISQVQNPSDNLRPLGLVNRRYKILGLGTHFFTWRNVPNNSPLVFWWSVPGHNWKPLFPPRKSDTI